ncbi:MAG: cytochrome c biogenesis protein CcmG/thiol:disulfide interchange protein DsbE [Bacteroidia bacterium]|jgi:cytochrome c biogenesis protein CcmG/thiol:disulfide interchange protein DsbE
MFLPLFIFAVLAMFLFRGLSLDPKEMPSALIDKSFPEFTLPSLGGEGALNNSNLAGAVSLLNVWATWCVACRVEHPYLQTLADQGIVIYGMNYKDEDAAALRWLSELGNPYRFNIADRDGTLGLDLGVYGAPETYLLDESGVIRYRHVGVVNERVWINILRPLYEELKMKVGQG